MRVGVFGGTFDPIHRGHVEPVLGVRRRLNLDRVLFLPTATPPHKDGPRHASALHRYAMVELALLHHRELHVAPLEMHANKPTYTVETLEHLQQAGPSHEHFLIVGADSFVQLPAWRDWRRILELVELAVMVRPGWSLEATTLAAEQHRAIEAGRVHFVENPPVDLSSSRIRAALADGAASQGETLPENALHPRVQTYIEKYALYR